MPIKSNYSNLFIKIGLILTLISFMSCQPNSTNDYTYESESLKIQKIDDNTFVHISYLETEKYGNVPCNGMIYINNGETIIFDTPSTDEVSVELINYVEHSLKCKVKYVVVNHFHVDCLGGLAAFHEKGIDSYSNAMTIRLAKENNEVIPKNGFEFIHELRVGEGAIINEYFGEAHTSDNIVCYIPSNKVLFGGCMIKSMKAGKGNLDDANTKEWSNTVKKIKEKYTDIRYVIPGHESYGGIELLDYTIEMFRE